MLKIFPILFLVFIVRAKVLLVTDQSMIKFVITQSFINLDLSFKANKLTKIFLPELESCTKINKSSVNDITELELIPENDTMTFINGSWKFTKPVVGPWPMHIFAEHYVQGQWLVQAYDRHYKDFCGSIKNPVEPWYYATKNLQGCPISAGVSKKNDNKIIGL